MTAPKTPALSVTYDGPTHFVATDRTPRPLAFHLRAHEPIPAGTRFRLLMGRFRSMLDNNPQRFRGWINFAAEAAGGGALSVIQGPPLAHHEMTAVRQRDPELFNHYIMGVAEVAEAIPAQATLTLWIEAVLSHQAPMAARVLVQGQWPGDAAYRSLGDIVELHNAPGPTVRLEARTKASPDATGVFPLRVHGVDAVWNPAEPTVPISGLTHEVQGPGELSEAGLRVSGPEPVRVVVRDPQRGFEAQTNPVRQAGFHGRRVYFGEFHWHTRFSGDGDRELEQAYVYARDTLGLDFAGVSDHTPKRFWAETLAINERFDEPGRFVSLPAWEWSTPTGHANVYLRTPEVPAGPDHAGTANHPGNAAWPDDAILIPHHTNIRSTNKLADGRHYWHEYDWSLPNQRVRLVELLQTRGNFEADELDGDWGIVTRGIGASVQDALAMGYRIGFVGGTDNHSGFPSRDAELNGDYIGLAGVLAEELSREAIWRAMDARRTYATSSRPILCHWRVNGHEMGEEAPLGDDRVTFTATLHGTAPIERVEVISNGRIVWRHRPDAYDVTLHDEALPAPDGRSAYYYLRLRQHDGHRAWLSPVWLDRP